MKALTKHAGTGCSGFRNEYLKVLSTDFSDARARTVVPLLEQFAEQYVNAELPPWFYYTFTAVKEVALVKRESVDPCIAPDVRPVGIGECLRRLIHTSVMAQHRDVLRDHLWPQQVAIGVPGGLSILVFGMRLLLEVHGDWVLARLDLRKTYNEILRQEAINRLNAVESLRSLVLSPGQLAVQSRPSSWGLRAIWPTTRQRKACSRGMEWLVLSSALVFTPKSNCWTLRLVKLEAQHVLIWTMAT